MVSDTVLMDREGRGGSVAARKSAGTLQRMSVEGCMHVVDVGRLLLHAHIHAIGPVSFRSKARHGATRVGNHGLVLVASDLILKAALTFFKGLAHAL